MSNPTFEPELDQPLPRQVATHGGCTYGCGIWFFRLFILPHTLVGLFLIFKAVASVVLSLGVLVAGTDVDGRIVRKIETKGKKDRVSYSAVYVYTVDQIEYEGTASLEADEYAAMREGQAITVKVYWPGVEGGHWPGFASYSPLEEVGGICFFALFWNGIVSIFVYMLYVLPWRLRQLVRWGQPTEGIVRDVQQHMQKGKKVIQVRYEYVVPPDGHSPGGVISGKASASGPKAEALHQGSLVTVLYDPRRPKRSLPYALSDFKAVAPPNAPQNPSVT